jgi:hypothetical protein
MRSPHELLPDELATLRSLWHLYPDSALIYHGKNHSKLDGLAQDGYIERFPTDLGVIYRLAPEHAAALARVVRANAEQADRN